MIKNKFFVVVVVDAGPAIVLAIDKHSLESEKEELVKLSIMRVCARRVHSYRTCRRSSAD